MTDRATVFYCPYCGEEDLRPAEAHLEVSPGAWACGSCRRAFTVRMLGPAAGPAPVSAGQSHSKSDPKPDPKQEAAL